MIHLYLIVTGFLSAKVYAAVEYDTSKLYPGGNEPVLTFDSAVQSIVKVANDTIGIVCTALFIVGAFFFTISAGDEQRKSLGVDLMKGAAMGMAIVVGANGIINMIMYFLS